MSRSRLTLLTLIATCFGVAQLSFAASASPTPTPSPTPSEELLKIHLKLDMSKWELIKRESGDINYYTFINDPTLPYLRARYQAGMDSAMVGYAIESTDKKQLKAVEWKWRAQVLPKGGDECVHDMADSAAGVHLMWKSGLRWYGLKYVWSAVGPKNAICDQRHGLFLVRDTVIRESGGPLNTWRTEKVELRETFLKHFRGGDPKGDVPDFVGIGLSTDGDQTQSESVADYTDFILVR